MGGQLIGDGGKGMKRMKGNVIGKGDNGWTVDGREWRGYEEDKGNVIGKGENGNGWRVDGERENRLRKG